MAANHAQEGVLAHPNRQPFRQALRRTTTKGKAEVTDNELHPRRPPPEWSSDPTVEAFRKNPMRTAMPLAAEAADQDLDLDGASMGGQVGE
jgi:hypothetical protein